ncbi:hypothetical protein AGMMS50229_07330 [Campylobacterota bacterium]|nr:hypothetical protein AGMMS50229_07330 [Campylobacterota bacterium]
MKQLVFNHDEKKLPKASTNLIPVQLFGKNNQTSYIGNNIIDNLCHKPVQIPPQAMDFLSVAMAVTAADTFVPRSDSEDGWTRELSLELPLFEPIRWQAVREDLERTLHFLSGDIWHFKFIAGGLRPQSPVPRRWRENRQLIADLDCVSLFSGGLDSAIGVIDLLHSGHKPLLVSHAYKGDKTHQDTIKSRLSESFINYQFNADPHCDCPSDITMRTRSFNFIAFGIISVCILQQVTSNNSLELIIPENGFISLNAPLTLRRIGSLSTRTTHPFFIKSMCKILKAVGLPNIIQNPYQFMTKGEMIANCSDKNILQTILDDTVSCSHWHRTNQQCGICVPCLIRRSAVLVGNIKERIAYQNDNVKSVLDSRNKNDDIQSIMLAMEKVKSTNVKSWILNNAPLPYSDIDKYEQVFRNGLEEVKKYLIHSGIAIQ